MRTTLCRWCFQVNRPETPEQERAHAKQLDDLTQYLMHLESA